MSKENFELRAQARMSLENNWGLAIAVFLIYALIVGSISIVPILGGLTILVIAGPMALGLALFTLSLSRHEGARLEQLFDGFQNFGNAIAAYLLMVLFVMLWTLLFIIPGIIAALAYSQIFYIMADDKSIGAMEALDKSKAMMDGYKWKYLLLGLSFIGWIILSLFTLGIGFLFLTPYMQVSYAKFYDDVKDN